MKTEVLISSNKNSDLKINYKDLQIIPPVILLMNAINLYIAHPHYVFTPGFFKAFGEDTVVVFLCWLAMRQLILRLDIVYPYQQNIIKRILLQIVLTLLLTCSGLLLLTWLIEKYRYGREIPHEVFTHHIWVYAFWIIIQNGIYVTMYFVERIKFQQGQISPTDDHHIENDVRDKTSKLTFRLGNKDYYVNQEDIRFCLTLGDLSKVRTANQQSFLTEKSLQDLESVLPRDLFFRINRQCIVHRDIITGIERIENGKLKVELMVFPDLPPSQIVSRTKAPELKEWLKGSILTFQR